MVCVDYHVEAEASDLVTLTCYNWDRDHISTLQKLICRQFHRRNVCELVNAQ